MKLTSPYKTQKIIEILNKEVDRPPSIFRSILTLNARYFIGTSPVCGVVNASGFELRNRKGPFWSLRIKGVFSEVSSGTEIMTNFCKPPFPDILGLMYNRHIEDKRVLLDFLKEWININYNSEQSLQL
jgi:hypothetical protein